MDRPRPWAHVRAALLLLLIASHAAIALPFGPKVTAKSIAKPDAQREVDAWMRLAGPLGFSREGFEETVITVSDWLVSTDKRWVGPMAKRFRRLGLGQAWALFAVPSDTPRRLEVRGISKRDRVLLYRRQDPDHDALADVFGYRRIRGIYDKGKRTGTYRRLFEWSAAQLFLADPSLRVIEMVQRERLVGAPHEGLPDTETSALRHTVRRDELMQRRPDLFEPTP